VAAREASRAVVSRRTDHRALYFTPSPDRAGSAATGEVSVDGGL